MSESDLYQKGSALRRQLLGDAYVDRVNTATYADPVMRSSSMSRRRRSSARCGRAPAWI
jgi:hypothetical protein